MNRRTNVFVFKNGENSVGFHSVKKRLNRMAVLAFARIAEPAGLKRWGPACCLVIPSTGNEIRVSVLSLGVTVLFMNLGGNLCRGRVAF